MDHPLISRRSLCRGASAASVLAMQGYARALGRTPVSGKLRLAIPWPVTSLDPHDPCDPTAALFAHAVFDQLYALETSGQPFPTLAADLPATEGGKTVVRLREGLVTAKGRKLDARDVVFSVQRARRSGATAWWGDLPVPAPHGKEPLAVVFSTADASRLAQTLSSPLFALVPRAFDPASPDGTGAMTPQINATRMVLKRNANAARGASFLEEVAVEQAADLSASLRSFEGNLTDIGWLGSGLHAPRPGAQAFDMGSVAWIVLQTGNEAGAWGAPGLAQRLLDGLAPERFQHFGLGALPTPTGSAEWGGKPCELLIQEGSAYLEELGRTVSSLLSRPGHEVSVKALPGADLGRRRAAGSYGLLLGVVRPFAAQGIATLVALAAASDPSAALELMRSPPRLSSFSPRALTRTLKLGVLGELRVTGAHAPDVRLAKSTTGEGWDLGSTYRAPGA
jgi:peptide/nickel transport system substrate-binding protein